MLVGCKFIIEYNDGIRISALQSQEVLDLPLADIVIVRGRRQLLDDFTDDDSSRGICQLR